MVQKATIRDCLLPGLDQAVPMVGYFGESLEYYLSSLMLEIRYFPCSRKVRMCQNTQSIKSSGLDGISFTINNEIINQHYFIIRLFSCMLANILNRTQVWDIHAKQSMKLQMKQSRNINYRNLPFLPISLNFAEDSQFRLYLVL